jgi:hypothetical protein
MRLVFAAFAVHAYTDNVLIATTACVFFAFATGVFAREAGRAPLGTGHLASARSTNDGIGTRTLTPT